MASLAPIKLPPVLAYIMGVPIAPRDAVERVIQKAIDELDRLDPDPDLEPNGDEEDGQFSEDEPAAKFAYMDVGPGCQFSDGLEDGDSDYCQASDDRGSSMPNARFPGYVPYKEIEADEDCERWEQPVDLH